ncbi:MAG: AAA family ATPase [Chitinivibrionia bacterium]|nr:AAA family ATPase [Chitinivibrionia bacterium]
MSDINPNSDKYFIDSLDLSIASNFPKFVKSIEFMSFRHITDLKIEFHHPISVVSGTNRSGKSTILMALACSHIEFKKQDVKNGKYRRHTWSDLMLFTRHDKQQEDWTYYITYKLGDKQPDRKRGQRKHTTKKWNGIGKKETQFKDRQVVFVDMDRILPARNFGNAVYWRAKNAQLSNISDNNAVRMQKYMSYVLEEKFTLNRVVSYVDKDVYKYTNSNEYSSYNAASGEEVLSNIIIDLVEADRNSLILIDEIEIGLHPKVQRRLMQVIYHIAKEDNKQFVITTHSPSILSSVPDKARVFIDKSYNGEFKTISNISINSALSRMDSESYPLVDLFCEDDTAKFIIEKAVSKIQDVGNPNFSELVNVIIVGSADKTYNCFQSHKNTYKFKKVKTGYACVLDGDMRSDSRFSEDECLHFLYSDFPPERFLTDEYEKLNPNTSLRYHINDSNCHCLFEKMNELSVGTNKREALEICWGSFVNTPDGQAYFTELQSFIISVTKKFSPDL